MVKQSNRPWFYAQKQTWYIWREGLRVSLKVKGEGNEAEAFRAWHRLLAEMPFQDRSQRISRSLSKSRKPSR